MSKNWKKILISGASLLMMASVGAGASNLARADVPSYIGPARTTKRLTARRVLYNMNGGYHLGMRDRLPKGSSIRVVGTLNAEDYNIAIPHRMGTYELNGFDVTHAFHHRRSHKSSFSAWFELERLFNRYGSHRSGNSAIIGGRHFKLATNISGAIENGHHIRNDSSALSAMKYAIRHPLHHYRKHSMKRIKKIHSHKVHKHVKKHVAKHVTKTHRSKSNKLTPVMKKADYISKHDFDEFKIIAYLSKLPNISNKQYDKQLSNAINKDDNLDFGSVDNNNGSDLIKYANAYKSNNAHYRLGMDMGLSHEMVSTAEKNDPNFVKGYELTGLESPWTPQDYKNAGY